MSNQHFLRARLTRAAALATALLFVRCSKGGDGGTGPSNLDVVVSPTAATLSVGATKQLTATITGSSDQRVAWASNNNAVASVDANGVVRALSAGTASIRAQSMVDASKTALAEITVNAAAPVTIALSAAATTIAIGGTYQLTATVTGASDTRVLWSSSAGGVASVDSNGLVRGIAAGTTIVTAMSVADPSKTATAAVTVSSSGGGGGSVTIVVTNSLVNTISITANGVAQGTVPAGQTRQTTVPYAATLNVSWDLVRPTTTAGNPVGEAIGGVFSPISSPSATINFTVDAVIGSKYIFSPLIVNQTSAALLMTVNGGLQGENRCNCTIPAGSSGTRFGYYTLFSNSNVRGFRDSSGYTGPYIYWDNFSPSVNTTTGSVTLTATTAPVPPAQPSAAASPAMIVDAPAALPLMGVRLELPSSLPALQDVERLP